MIEVTCRFCGATAGTVVLDLGEQPACDRFPRASDQGPDPTYPLRMWLCAACMLAQLAENPAVVAEPHGQEPTAVAEQRREAIRRIVSRGLLPPGTRVHEYGSPHGGSWKDQLLARGACPADPDGPADVVIDCFAMMHEPDQRAAIAERAARLAPGGVLLMQFHSLATVLRSGQWNTLRHGRFAYYSTPVLVEMLAQAGLYARSAELFSLYGGTVMLIVGRSGAPDAGLRGLIAYELRTGIRDAAAVGELQTEAEFAARRLADHVTSRHEDGARVYGYSAASRAVSLLTLSGLTTAELPAIADASAAKQGHRMPGTDIPVISPRRMLEATPDDVVLFVPDLLAEVRDSLPQIEKQGGSWVLAEAGTGR